MTYTRILPLVLAGGALVLTGCLPEEESRVYSGETVVEFGPQQSRGTTYAFTTDGNGNNYLYRRNVSNPTATTPTVRDSVEVQVVTAEGRASALAVNFELDKSGANTAPEGTAYQMITTSPVTVPAGAYSAKIYFNVLRRATMPSVRDTIRFVLNDGTGYKASKNNRRFRVAIQ